MIQKILFSLLLILAAPLHAAGFTPIDRVAAGKLMDASNYHQPTIVALWSSDCSHCKKNLALLSSLTKTDKRIRVITLAAEVESSELAPLLDRYPLNGARYAYGNDNPEAIAYAIDPNWAGELPRTYFFNGSGGKEKVSGVITSSMLEKFIPAKLH